MNNMNNTTTHSINFSVTRSVNNGTREAGTFQILSSTRLFHVFAVKQPDGSFIGNYHGTEETRLQLVKDKAEKLAFICGMYGIGGQSVTCDDGVKLGDGSWLYNGSYNCWSD